MRIVAVLPVSMGDRIINGVLETMYTVDHVFAMTCRHPDGISVVAPDGKHSITTDCLAKYVLEFKEVDKAFVPDWRYIAPYWSMKTGVKTGSWFKIFKVASEPIAEMLCRSLIEAFNCQALWCPDGESYPYCFVYINEFFLYLPRIMNFINTSNIRLEVLDVGQK
jgi:hypothetical protein